MISGRPVLALRGIVSWPRGVASGVLLYRLTLLTEDGGHHRVTGKLVLVR